MERWVFCCRHPILCGDMSLSCVRNTTLSRSVPTKLESPEIEAQKFEERKYDFNDRSSIERRHTADILVRPSPQAQL